LPATTVPSSSAIAANPLRYATACPRDGRGLTPLQLTVLPVPIFYQFYGFHYCCLSLFCFYASFLFFHIFVRVLHRTVVGYVISNYCSFICLPIYILCFGGIGYGFHSKLYKKIICILVYNSVYYIVLSIYYCRLLDSCDGLRSDHMSEKLLKQANSSSCGSQ
jgi:hypothetical protein